MNEKKDTTNQANHDSEQHQDGTPARFAYIWKQVQRHNATLFLRHALKLDLTLEQVVGALKFENSGELASKVRLGDLLQLQLQQSASQPSVSTRSAQGQRNTVKARRKRRGPEEISRLREAVLDRMRAAMGSVTTSHLCDVLNNGDFEVDLLQMNRVLNALEQDGYLLNLGGKPRNWRLKPQGRMAPEPMTVVRRTTAAPGE